MIDTTKSPNAATTILNAGFDIALLASPEKIAKVHTVEVAWDADGNMSAGFDIVGKDSVQYRDVIRSTSVAAIKRSQTKKEQIDAKTEKGAGTLYDLGENRNRKIAIAVTVGAPGFVSNGVPVELTEGFLNLCFDAKPTWEAAILAALDADANFSAI